MASDLVNASGEDRSSALVALRSEIHRRFRIAVDGGRVASDPRSVARSRVVWSTGSDVVDAILPGGGVPVGKLVEVAGRISSGKTSLVASLVAEVQRQGRRVAWIDPWAAFYAPAAERAGILLDRLLLVQPPLREERPVGGTPPPEQEAPGRTRGRRFGGPRDGGPRRSGPQEGFRAAEHLLRSGAFALVVMDAVGLPGRGVTAPLFRLDRRARQHGTTLVLITDHPERSQSLGACIALRLCIERRAYCFEPRPSPPFGLTGYRIEVQLGKVKGALASSSSPSSRGAPAEGASLLDVRHPEGVA